MDGVAAVAQHLRSGPRHQRMVGCTTPFVPSERIGGHPIRLSTARV